MNTENAVLMACDEIMSDQEYKRIIESLLFAGGDPVSIGRMAAVLEISPAEAKAYADALTDEYESQQRGIRIKKLNDSYQMCTCEKYASYIKRMLEIKRNSTLSQAAIEVLAIIAYNQPVTKAFIEQVRGVDCGGVINTLVEKELVEEAGRLELPGRPIAYKTGYHFLRSFSLSSIEELPPVESADEQNGEQEENLFDLMDETKEIEEPGSDKGGES